MSLTLHTDRTTHRVETRATAYVKRISTNKSTNDRRTHQGQQLVEPSADAKVPAGHAVHSVSPGIFVNVPAGHGVPAGRPVWLQYAPGVQGEHTPAPPELYVPMGQASQTVEPG